MHKKRIMRHIKLKTKPENQTCILFAILTTLILTFFASCEYDEYTIEYQDGYPNMLAGNWIAVEYQNAVVKNNIPVSVDNISEPFDLVSALDPNSNDSLVIDNIYDSKIRVKTYYSDSTFNVTMGKQLEVINYGQYGIYFVSIDGRYNYNEEAGEYLTMHIGLYDKYFALFDTMFVVAFRKTGFEDVDYESLLSY